MNEWIRASPVRLIDANEEMLGVVKIEDALRRAREAGLDLVEISSAAVPPVVRIMDFGKWKYEKSKKDKATKAKTKTSELKEVRLGRSMKIDPHDITIRLDQARRFLIDGHKVQIVQNFRGREMLHRERGHQRMKDIVERMSDVAKLEVPPRQLGRRISMILAPDKAKIDQLKRREAADPTATDSSPAEATPTEVLPAADRTAKTPTVTQAPASAEAIEPAAAEAAAEKLPAKNA